MKGKASLKEPTDVTIGPHDPSMRQLIVEKRSAPIRLVNRRNFPCFFGRRRSASYIAFRKAWTSGSRPSYTPFAHSAAARTPCSRAPQKRTKPLMQSASETCLFSMRFLASKSKIYPAHVRTRKSFGLMTRKLSVTESQYSGQHLGTFSRRKSSVASANSRYVA